MTTQTTRKIVYVTDSGFLKPTLVSIWSLLDTIRGQAELHVWGHGLSARDWDAVRRVAAVNPAVVLHRRDLDDEAMKDAHGPKDYISAATMGRLFIPRHLGGPVLYIDGDTLVTGDVGPLFDLDLGRHYAAVIRDYTLIHWLADDGVAPDERGARLPEVAGLMGGTPSADYFNAGIMMFNCDAIRSDPDLLAAVEDVARASAHSHGDQDHLNALFAGHVLQLDIGWNLSWGRRRRHLRLLSRLGVTDFGALPRPSAIIHYHGPHKPWRRARRDVWSSRGRATWHYRRRLARFARSFPDLLPS